MSVRLKAERNLSNGNPKPPFTGRWLMERLYSLVGNPNLGEVRGVLVGVENAQDASGTGAPVCTEVWINELRLSGTR